MVVLNMSKEWDNVFIVLFCLTFTYFNFFLFIRVKLTGKIMKGETNDTLPYKTTGDINLYIVYCI